MREPRNSIVFGNNHDPSFQRSMRTSYDSGYDKGYAAGVLAGRAQSAAACAARAARHGDAAERLLPGGAAREFVMLRGEAAACERAVRELGEP